MRDEHSLQLFGQNLKKIRTEKKLSQEQLANSCDLPISQIGRIERGEINTSLSHAFLIAKTMGIHPKQLFDFDSSN
ncbi:hypothetical protein A9P82_11400 [Arachidicoccus ginsenosidimutans]|uniref:helix-turn-helix domain-containing protein n=1 Tax=Arachidicoccus sp. BS20 TaxID=1850526 RepID=UPI0007F13EF7|nr:helix-turn-helix transcriptional regulator [Arachidicoccus sp. BS20]ANI90749.1 hypothetical protein A9P82_11400 [Arachidicoccus sp. BS20]